MAEEKKDTATQTNLLEEDLGVGTVLLEVEEKEKQKQQSSEQEKQQQQQQPLILGRFKTYQDLEKSYRELERAYTQTSQMNAEYRRQLEQLQSQQQPQQSSEINPDEFYTKFWENPKQVLEPLIQDTVKKIVLPQLEPIIQERELSAVRNAINNFSSTHPDFEQYREQIAEIIEKEIPPSSNLPADKLLEMAYSLAKVRNLSAITEEAKNQGKQELLEKTKTGFVESSTGASMRTQQQEKTPEERIKESILKAEVSNPLFE